MATLMADEGDLWDSGAVASRASSLIPYGGKELHSRADCYWKVRVQDGNGGWSCWSAPARWTMGLLSPADWKGEWIGCADVFERKQGWPPPDNDLPDPWFRKEFDLEKQPERAVFTVASIGYHEVYINGEKVSPDVLSPAVTDHKHRVRYVTYEVAPYLRPGRNAIGLWLGYSWSIFPPFKTEDRPQTPLALAQLDVEMESGRWVSVPTDDSWKTHPSPNTTIGVWDFMHYGGERYDGRVEVGDWSTAGFDASGWVAATEYELERTLSAEMVEPNRIIKAIKPVSIEEADGGYRVDMGVNFVGWMEVLLRGEPGATIELQFSEREDQMMTHRLRSQYIIGPSGEGVFRNRFNYHSGRWVYVRGLDQQPEMDDFTGYFIRTDYARSGHFQCSNLLLNDIYESILWTYENLSLGGYVVDCPQRERMGYGGDAHATTETGLYNYDLGAFYTKWSQDWRDVQDETGNLPYTAPTYWGGGGPAWSGYCVTLPWEMYRRYGDRRILEQNFDTITRWLAFLETKAEDNMLVRWGGEWDFLGDWLWPGADGVNGDHPETLFFNNCYWVYNLQTAARIASILGREEAAKEWLDRTETVKTAVHARFYHPEDGSYANGFQGYLAIALLIDLPPDDEVRAKVWKRLEDEILVKRNGHIHAGITAGAFLFKTLMVFDRPDLVFPMMIQTDEPGWGFMLASGSTTIWESWEGDNSRLHSSYLYPGAWFIESLGGIRPGRDGAGFRRFTIKPCLLEDRPLGRVEASLESEFGPISCAWELEGDQLTCRVVIPPNTEAQLLLPAMDPDAVRESGKPLSDAPGVQGWSVESSELSIQLGSGEYSFLVETP
jgi:alpha-L-rhamnosidase